MMIVYEPLTKITETAPTAEDKVALGNLLGTSTAKYGTVTFKSFFFQSSELCRVIIWPSVDYAIKGSQARTSYWTEAGIIWSMIS